MDLDELLAFYPEMNVNDYRPSQNLRDEQDLEYEKCLAQDQSKKIEKEKQNEKEQEKQKEQEKEQKQKEQIEPDPPKPTLAELRQLRIAKLSPVQTPDYTKCTVAELKKICKERGLKGFTHKCKQDLIQLL
jgi:hypothetical protein